MGIKFKSYQEGIYVLILLLTHRFPQKLDRSGTAAPKKKQGPHSHNHITNQQDKFGSGGFD